VNFAVSGQFKSEDKNPVVPYPVREGEGVALPCYDRPVIVPAGRWSWYYKSGENAQNQIPVHKLPRMDIDANGNLSLNS
jgi:hypothetical protein